MSGVTFVVRICTLSVPVLFLVVVAACGGDDPTAVNSSPTVTIVSPDPGATRVEGESFTFTASASDAEDGDVSASLEWTSDVDGALGTGASVTATLTLGEHTVTAGATDAQSATGSSSVTVEVVPILQADESCEGQSGAAVVSFADVALESAVRDELGVGPAPNLTCEDAGSLSALTASGVGIADLTGAQNLTGLDTLDLQSNQIVDVAPIDALPLLSELDLRDNAGLEDLTPLMNHPGLGSGDTVRTNATAASCVEVVLVASGGATVTSGCPTVEPAIVFTVITPDGWDIYSMNGDGTNVVQLTDAPGDDQAPQWSPDGSKIAFASERDGNFEIYTMDPDGSNQTRLTTAASDDRWPTWSPDGSQIAFERSGTLATMDADGSNQTTLSTGLAAAGWPDWSPDGTQLVATAHTGVSFDVYVVDLATSDTTNLTDTETNENHPTWSDDGTTIVFSRKDAADDVWIMGADGTGQTKLTAEGTDNLHPDWSPDGEWIVFQSNRTGNGQIFAMKPDGSVIVEIGGSQLGDLDPSWR